MAVVFFALLPGGCFAKSAAGATRIVGIVHDRQIGDVTDPYVDCER